MTIQVEHRGVDYALVRIYGNGDEAELEVSLNLADAIDHFNKYGHLKAHELPVADLTEAL